MDGLLHGSQGLAGAFLNPAIQLIVLAFDVLEVVIRQVGPFLLQFALGDVPVAFDFEGVHNWFFRFRVG